MNVSLKINKSIFVLFSVKLAELSSDSSDNETLATVKQKLSKTDRVQKATPKQKKTKLAESLPTGRGQCQESCPDKIIKNQMNPSELQCQFMKGIFIFRQQLR